MKNSLINNRKIMAAALASTILMTACSTTAGTEAPETTAATTEATSEATTEATTTTSEETTEATTVPTYTDDMLPMTINEVADAVLEAMGSDYNIFVEFDPNSEWYIDPEAYSEKNRSVGIVNIIELGRIFYSETDNEDEEYNTKVVYVNIFEFDVNSEEYLKLIDDGEFSYYFGANTLYNEVLEYTEPVTAINKQYVISITAMLGNDYGFSSDDPSENEPPFTIGKAQEAYEAFIALK